MKFLRLLSAASVVFLASAAQAASIGFSGSQVVGVSGLTVDGVIYDAIFHDATYNQLLLDFPSPDYDTNYSAAFAEAATRALYQFAVTEGGFAGISTDDINGCSSLTNCFLSTTVEQNSLHAWSIDYNGDAQSGVPTFYSFHIFPADNVGHHTHVVWDVSAIPLPATFWLFWSGVIGLVGISTKKRRYED